MVLVTKFVTPEIVVEATTRTDLRRETIFAFTCSEEQRIKLWCI